MFISFPSFVILSANTYCHKIMKITLIVRAIVLFIIIKFFEVLNGSKYQI